MKDLKLYKILKPMLKAFTYMFLHPKVIGRENILQEEPIILAGNHTSILDPVLLIAVIKRNIHFLAKDTLWKGPKKIIFSNLELIPVNRKIKDKTALKKAEEYLRKGEVIGIFPEGTTNKNEKLLSFKIGAVKMSYDTSAKIIPFAITGSYKPFKRLKIEFGKAIIIKNNNLSEENDKLRNKIQKMKEI